MNRCAIYIRVSLEEQVEQYGLASQLRAIQDRAKERGYTLSDPLTFRDEGFLGSDLDRPALTRLRDLARSGGIDVVLVHDPDRLSRKLSHLLLIRDELEQRNVRLEFITTASDTTPEGKMFLNMKGIFSEYEREKIRERTLRGRREKARQGFIVGGISPYGYRYEGKSAGHKGRFVVDEEQAAVVRQIFAWSVEGVSTREIAARLNANGVAPKKANSWGKSSIFRILRNETYVGIAYYNRRQNIEPVKHSGAHRERHNKKTVHRERASAEWITVAVPAIIPRALFDRVAMQLQRNAEILVGKPSRSYLLRGLVWCGECGKRLYACPAHGVRYYRCESKDRLTKTECASKSVHADKVEACVWEAVAEPFANPELLRNLIAKRSAEILPNRDAGESRRLAKQIEQLKRREFRATQAMLDAELGEYHARFRSELMEAQKQRRALEERLAEFSNVATNANDVDSLIAEIARFMPSITADQRGPFLRRFVRSIKVIGKEAEINCAVPIDGYRSQHQHGVDDNKARIGFVINVKIA